MEGATTTFHCNATGNPTPKITWTKDGKTVATGDTLRFEANRNQSGEYWCSADNGLDTTVNASAKLDVQCKCKHIHCQEHENKSDFLFVFDIEKNEQTLRHA